MCQNIRAKFEKNKKGHDFPKQAEKAINAFLAKVSKMAKWQPGDLTIEQTLLFLCDNSI